MFDDDYIKSLPEDPHRAMHQICKEIIQQYSTNRALETSSQYQNFLNAIGLLRAYNKSNTLGFVPPKFFSDKKTYLTSIVIFCRETIPKLEVVLTNQDIEISTEAFLHKLNNAFAYEFSEEDLKRIQILINELRDIITDSVFFEENHQERLLNRLEKLQQELHKKMSDLDKLWALFGEAGVALGKFGNDAKPLVDRINEVLQIIMRTQAKAESLPENMPIPQLGSGEEEDEN